MTILALETVIARLCVDYRFRRAFAEDRDTALRPFDLTRDEEESIGDLDMHAIAHYAQSLLGKRLHLIDKWLPLTTRILRREVQNGAVPEVMLQYALENVRDDDGIGGEWVRYEAARVCEELRKTAANGAIAIPHFQDVLSFEETKLWMMNDPEVQESAIAFERAAKDSRNGAKTADAAGWRPLTGKHVQVRVFNYDMSKLMSSVEEDGDLPLEREKTWILFLKKPGLLHAITSTLNAPSRDVLSMSDGNTELRTIWESLYRSYGEAHGLDREQLVQECMFLVTRLQQEGAITFV